MEPEYNTLNCNFMFKTNIDHSNHGACLMTHDQGSVCCIT